MISKQIIEMAKQAICYDRNDKLFWGDAEQLQAFAQLVRNAALDEAAKIAESHLRNTAMLTSNPPKSSAAWETMVGIRALKNDIRKNH